MNTRELIDGMQKQVKPSVENLHKVIRCVYSEDYKPGTQQEVYGRAHGKPDYGYGRDACFAFLEIRGILVTDEQKLVQRAI